MKKILSIALIAALALTSVFAATYNGKAALELGYNLDDSNYGFANSVGHKLKWTLELEAGTAGSEGEGDLKAVIAAEFSIKNEIADDDDMVDGNLEKEINKLAVEAKITKADILYKELVRVGILNAGKSADYAKSFYKNTEKKNVNNVEAVEKIGNELVPGFNFTVAGFNGGFGLTGKAKDETVKYLAWAETKSFELSEGLTAQAAAIVAGDQDAAQFGVSAKAAYKNEDAKLSASVATDFGYKEEKAALDLAVKAGYDFVTLDAYVGTADSFENTEFGAKVAATYKFENGSVGGSFAGQNMADKATGVAREFKATVNGDYTYQPVKAEAEVSYAIIAKTLTVKPAVSYIHEVFTAKAALELGVKFAENTTVTAIKPSVTVSSDKIINNATLELGWTGADFAESANKKGKIVTSATISF
mgnify:FL=1